MKKYLVLYSQHVPWNTWVWRVTLFYLEVPCLSIPAEDFDLGSTSTASSQEQGTSLSCLVQRAKAPVDKCEQ